MNLQKTLVAAAVLIAGFTVQIRADEAKITSRQLADMISGVEASIARVEYTLKYDRGDQPTGSGWANRCPNCGNYHGDSNAANYVKEERPFIVAGYFIAPDRVVSRDLTVHPRFVEAIHIAGPFGRIRVSAVDWVTDRSACILHLESAPANARPLSFDTSLPGPYFAVVGADANGRWSLTCKPVTQTTSVDESGAVFHSIDAEHALLVDKQGRPVAMSMRSEYATDDQLRQPLADWTVIPAGEVMSKLADLESAVNAGIPRVHISLRSPKKGSGSRSRWGWSDDDDDSSTELHVPGLVIGDRRILVLANLKRKSTARLKRIVVHPPSGDPVEATFVGSLKDYGCFLAELASPMSGGLRLDKSDILKSRHDLLLAAHVMIQGEQRVQYFDHARFASFDRRWNSRNYPTLAGQESDRYLFTRKGELRAFSLKRRTPVSVESSWNQDEVVLMPSDLFAEMLASVDSQVDENNVPLTEEDENRLAWMGVEMQALNEELARVNKVSNLTKDGEIGGMVSYVYEGSPAAEAGIVMGDILIQLHIEGQPKPLEINPDGGYGYMSEFPWERLSDLPEAYFDQIPKPWPSADNALNVALTDAGFGKKYTADVFRNGNVEHMSFTIVEGPRHYESSPRHKSEPLGLTVRELTYENRRYFRIVEGEPGVIISKIEPGSKASVAGLRPFEIITHIGESPVHTVGEFKASVTKGDELRISVKRMTKGRIVTIRVPDADADSEARIAGSNAAEAGNGATEMGDHPGIDYADDDINDSDEDE